MVIVLVNDHKHRYSNRLHQHYQVRLQLNVAYYYSMSYMRLKMNQDHWRHQHFDHRQMMMSVVYDPMIRMILRLVLFDPNVHRHLCRMSLDMYRYEFKINMVIENKKQATEKQLKSIILPDNWDDNWEPPVRPDDCW